MNTQRPRYQHLLAAFTLELLVDLLTAKMPPPGYETTETEDERIDRIAGELLADVNISFA